MCGICEAVSFDRMEVYGTSLDHRDGGDPPRGPYAILQNVPPRREISCSEDHISELFDDSARLGLSIRHLYFDVNYGGVRST
jgi:hypothetical protein